MCQISFGEPSDVGKLEVVALSTKSLDVPNTKTEGRRMNCSIAG